MSAQRSYNLLQNEQFRGVEPAGTGFIMGHEFVGEIVEMGSAVKTLQKGHPKRLFLSQREDHPCLQ
jgi:D-arabinose 1-dehydrogenase-like Zn-dependent alcohol dehydrogenase